MDPQGAHQSNAGLDIPSDPVGTRRPVHLSLRHLRVCYGDLEVLPDLSLDVHGGELCCLLGPSGCGKTTTLKVVAGFVAAEGGSVHLAGQDITHVPPQRRNVGMVFQNYALFPHMNVYENVAYGLRRRRWADRQIRPKVAEALALVRLGGLETRRIHQLSGGQQQRVALARALIIEPQLLLLDEPLSNLDARLRAEMRDEIRRIQRAIEITMVYVTHDQEEAMSLADRIVVMHQGHIEQIDSPVGVYERPATRFVADFVGRVNLLAARVVEGKLALLGRRFALAEGLWPEGTELTCAVRPERLSIRPPGEGCVPAVVHEATYLGAVVRYRLAAAEDITLDAELPSPEAVYRPGQAVGVALRVEDMSLFA